jgi:protein ImuB
MFACIHVPNSANEAHAVLLDSASMFSPRVEDTAPDTVVFDLDGLERLWGSYEQLANKIFQQVLAHGIQANVAVASNPDAAIAAARGLSGITVLSHGNQADRLADLPLTVLPVEPEVLETLERWGVRSFGAFAKLPTVEVSERLGQYGIQLHKLARGVGTRPLVPYRAALQFIETIELEHEIDSLEPLTFVLTRLVEQLCSRLRTRNLATHEVHLTLNECVRVLQLPLPIRNSKLLTKLLVLDLEAHPPATAVTVVTVETVPAKPRVVQNGLFVPLSPEPEKLQVTLARIAAVVGEENVGSPEVLDTHRPDAFRMKKFGVVGVGSRTNGRLLRDGNSPPKLGGVARSAGVVPMRNVEASAFRLEEPPRLAALGTPPNLGGEFRRLNTFSSLNTSLALRLFRPPLDATVQLRNGTPAWIAFQGVHGPIATVRGPWRTSGDWWRANAWDREEWDIEVLESLYRIYYDVHIDRWFAEGVYD